MLRRNFISILLAGILAVTAPFAAAQDYYPPAIGDYDGANDYLSHANALTGAASSKKGIFSSWIRIDGSDASWRDILGNSGDKIIVQMSIGNEFRVYGENAASGVILDISTGSTYLAGTNWIHFLASWDLAAGTSHIYINDSDDAAAPVALVDDVIVYTATTWTVGARYLATNKFSGAFSELYFAPNQYLDFSDTANRRFFIDANGNPVDLGPSCSTPTGTASIVCMRTQFNNPGLNDGTGGDFVLNGAPTYTQGPVPISNHTYTNTTGSGGRLGTAFDGSSDYYTKVEMDGTADGPDGTFSLWIRPDGINTPRTFFGSSGGFVTIRIENLTNTLLLSLHAVGAAKKVGMQSTVQLTDSTHWYHALASWSAGTAIHLYIDGVEALNLASDTNIAGDIDYTREANIAAASAGAQVFAGTFSEFYLNQAEYIDLSVAANREKFISPAGRPVYLGPTCALPTGTAAIVCLPDGDASDNRGTGGDFVANGSPTPILGPEPIMPTTWTPGTVRGRGGRGGRSTIHEELR